MGEPIKESYIINEELQEAIKIAKELEKKPFFDEDVIKELIEKIGEIDEI